MDDLKGWDLDIKNPTTPEEEELPSSAVLLERLKGSMQSSMDLLNSISNG